MGINSKISRKAVVEREICVACGACTKVCPRKAISIWKGCFAAVESESCVGCGKCEKTCPASCITIERGETDNEN